METQADGAVPAPRPGVEAARVEPAGLTEADAARLLQEHGPNVIPAERRASVPARVLAQLRDPMILLLLAAAVLAAVLRDLTDTAVIAAVVVLNTLAGLVQELRAERTLAALRELAAPVARVIREGRGSSRPAADLVPGDLILLEAGDVVPADARVATASGLQVDEAALTGESVPVDKSAPMDSDAAADRCTVFAGTVVTHGRGSGVVERTGADSALGRIAQTLAGVHPRPTPLQKQLNHLGKILTVVALALSGLVLVSGLLRGLSAGDMLLTAISLAVAAVPESLPAVATLGLALGAHRMARRSAVVRRLPAVETLGSVTVVAADKTGTLTEGRMLAERLWTPVDGHVWASGSGYAPVGELCAEDRSSLAPTSTVTSLLRDVLLCNDAGVEVDPEDGTQWRAVGDPTEAALVALAAKGGVPAGTTRRSSPRILEVPFESARARMTTVHSTLDPDRWLTVCKGAPEVLLGEAGLLTDTGLDRARAVAAELGAAGYRVLAVAHRTGPRPESATAAESNLQLAGLVAITDPARPEAAAVVAAFRAAGVGLIMITGDHPATAMSVAARVGIVVEPAAVATGQDLDGGLLDHHIAAKLVFARIRPEQKLDIVQALQRQGHVVAMTGDGVNDGPALRAADIGVAMGGSGTEVARQAADLVLTDDNLGTVVAAIEEGRRIYTNIRTFLRYALAGGVAEVLVMLLGPFVGLAVPLLPAQILWINMITHGLPGVAMGAEPGAEDALLRGPRAPGEQVLGGGLWRRIAWTGTLIASVTFAVGVWAHQGDRAWQTLIFLVLGFAQLGVALALRRPAGDHGSRLHFLDVAVLLAAGLQYAAVAFPPLRDLLGLDGIGPAELAVVLAASALPGLAVYLAERRRRKTSRETAARTDVSSAHLDVVESPAVIL